MHIHAYVSGSANKTCSRESRITPQESSMQIRRSCSNIDTLGVVAT